MFGVLQALSIIKSACHVFCLCSCFGLSVWRRRRGSNPKVVSASSPSHPQPTTPKQHGNSLHLSANHHHSYTMLKEALRPLRPAQLQTDRIGPLTALLYVCEHVCVWCVHTCAAYCHAQSQNIVSSGLFVPPPLVCLQCRRAGLCSVGRDFSWLPPSCHTTALCSKTAPSLTRPNSAFPMSSFLYIYVCFCECV